MNTDTDIIEYVADRCASREVDALTDFYEIGRAIVTGEMSYDNASTRLVKAFVLRNLKPSTAKTYLCQGFGLAQLFPTFDEMAEWADAECGSSRSLKRLYDTVNKAGKAEAAGEIGEPIAELTAGETVTDTDRANAAIAILRGISDAACIAMVRDAAAGMLGPIAIAA